MYADKDAATLECAQAAARTMAVHATSRDNTQFIVKDKAMSYRVTLPAARGGSVDWAAACQCGVPRWTHLPCAHMLSCTQHIGMDRNQLVDDVFSFEAAKRTLARCDGHLGWAGYRPNDALATLLTPALHFLVQDTAHERERLNQMGALEAERKYLYTDAAHCRNPRVCVTARRHARPGTRAQGTRHSTAKSGRRAHLPMQHLPICEPHRRT